VKENFLNPSDRAALQGLIPLAGALGAGTIFALFFGGSKRGSGTAVFELFAIAAVLASVGMTAYLAIALLHQNEPISNKDLTQTATPLIFAAFLLVFVSMLTRVSGSVERFFATLPLALGAGVLAAWFSSSSWSFEPSEVIPLALATIAFGGVAALFAWGLDRVYARWDRDTARQRFQRLSRVGYQVEEREMKLALPSGGRSSRAPIVSCWIRKEKIYLDRFSCRQLRDLADARWQRMGSENSRPPQGAAALIKAKVSNEVLWLCGRRTACIWTFEPGRDDDARAHDLEANDDGLLDITHLGFV